MKPVSKFLELLGHLEHFEARLGLARLTRARRGSMAGAFLTGHRFCTRTGRFFARASRFCPFGAGAVTREGGCGCKGGDGQGDNDFFHSVGEFVIC